jgi:hypothetical protein
MLVWPDMAAGTVACAVLQDYLETSEVVYEYRRVKRSRGERKRRKWSWSWKGRSRHESDS